MNTRVPYVDEITDLHRRYAQNETVFELVYRHCVIVNEIALWCADNLADATIDRDILAAGCLLHDIGTYALFDKNGHIDNMRNYRQHAIFGAALATEEGFDDRIADMIQTHVQLGLSKQEIIDNQFALPRKDYQPTTIEGRLLCYADRFHSKRPAFNAYEPLLARLQSDLPDQAHKLQAWSQEFGIPDVTALAKKYGHPIR